MKLWQKIFLLTLALVILVVNTTSLALLTNNHRLAIEREQQNALARHNYLITEMQNTLIYTQLLKRTVTLSEDEMLAVVFDVLERQRNDSTTTVSLFKNDVSVSPETVSSAADSPDTDSSVAMSPDAVSSESTSPVAVYPVGHRADSKESILLDSLDYSSTITENAGNSYLLIASGTSFNNQPYKLISSTDISSTYALFRADFYQVGVVGIISAFIVAGLLLVVVLVLLRPLNNLSNTTNKIADGDLSKRAQVRGNDEIAKVAQNFNSMADSIERNMNELASLAESRRVFINNLAHEMRTPLTSVLGFADILRVKRKIDDAERIEYANIIVSETKRLKSLSGKLMELLTTGNTPLAWERIEIHELVEELVVAYQPILAKQNIDLICELPDGRTTLSADKELLKSLIFNLIDNSMKASSSKNSIWLKVSTTITSVTFSVVDEGVGIPPDQIPMLTEPFFMLDKARTRKHGGAGLGLALCAEIARSHNSKLVIESELGKGTKASITLAKAPANIKQYFKQGVKQSDKQNSENKSEQMNEQVSDQMSALAALTESGKEDKAYNVEEATSYNGPIGVTDVNEQEDKAYNVEESTRACAAGKVGNVEESTRACAAGKVGNDG